MQIQLRVSGINAPELSTGAPGAQATEALKGLIVDKPLLVTTRKSTSGSDERSFDRWVCYAWVQQGDGTWISVGDWMVANGRKAPSASCGSSSRLSPRRTSSLSGKRRMATPYDSLPTEPSGVAGTTLPSPEAERLPREPTSGGVLLRVRL
jgi:hypothetical protein